MINEKFEQMKKPANFRTLFKTQKEFESWLDLGNAKDLECTLKEFEKAELYEDCIIIKKHLDYAISSTHTN